MSTHFWSGDWHGPEDMERRPAAGEAAASQSIEIEREIESMQFSYLQEKRRLEAQIRDVACEVQQLHERAEACSSHPPRRSAPDEESSIVEAEGTMLEASSVAARRVKWRLENARAMRSCHQISPDPNHRLQERFRLEECPGVEFALAFYPTGGSSHGSAAQNLPGSALPCRLALRAVGEACQGLHLGVKLSVDLEESGYGRSGRQIAFLSGELRGDGEVVCDGLWPADAPASAVVFGAELTVLGWDAEVLCYESEWMKSNQGANEADCLDDDDSDSEDD
eukprot:gnl/TRDRNA2_/TRDRNA2_197774_c0_seq1.p1 gnl/TRDRNA2_/TRDRNA2_197774_c0~~gnl/TRDRNA2_/TRDRNA2_197774_c0_seq1.p1  ORF type:complete len:280 (+),score=46.71 gnl/TRDRNA2_/TRDRNA2_197774_c0_seq1:78-917(+)